MGILEGFSRLQQTESIHQISTYKTKWLYMYLKHLDLPL